MKVTIENKKGLNKDLKVFVDKKTMNTYMDDKYEEIIFIKKKHIKNIELQILV